MHKLLLVAEDPILARLLDRALRQDADVEVVLAHERALARLARGPDPDALIVDFDERSPDAAALCERLASASDLPPMVVLTSYISARAVAALGEPLLVQKPFALRELRLAVAEALETGAAGRGPRGGESAHGAALR